MLEGVPLRIVDLLRATRAAIAAAEVGDTPALDADLLVGHATGLDRVALRTRSDELVTPEQARAVDALLGRRLAGEPVAYLLGTQWFYGREFEVDARVLVPRPETEALVELALEHVADAEAFLAVRVVDACTGSGCVAISIAAELPRAEVIGTDISEDALDVARANAQRHAPGVRLVLADLLDGLADELAGTVDVITANPPYVDGVDAAGLEAAVRDHEPHVALFAPEEGVAAFYERLATQAAVLLAPDGLLAVEHGVGQRALVTAAFERAGLTRITAHDDLAGIDRVVVGRGMGSSSGP